MMGQADVDGMRSESAHRSSGGKKMRSARTDEVSERQVWYLLLHYGVPWPFMGETIEGHFDVVRRSCKPVGVTVVPVELALAARKAAPRLTRYVFRFPRYCRDDDRALRFAETFDFAFAVGGTPLVAPDHDGYVVRVPRALVGPGGRVSFGALVELEERRGWDQQTLRNPYSAISMTAGTSTEAYEVAWRLVPLLLRRNDLFDAARFLKASQDDFFVYPGEVAGVLEASESQPAMQRDQTRFETALHNAFKAVEAVIGDPPRDERKYFGRLRAAGLDPHELVGHTSKEEIHTVIREMNQARDKKSAHGSTRNRTITVGEMFKYHCCARYVVVSALEKELGAPVFTDTGEESRSR